MKKPIDILKRLPNFSGYLTKKPLFALRAMNNMIRTYFRGQSLITAIEYAVIYDCQASCEKCSSANMTDHSRPRLTTDEVRQLGNDCHKLGAYEVNFTGGEPLLENELEHIISYFHPESNFIGINTNGFLLDRSRIMSLREAGTDLFKISLDSPLPEEHDRMRGIPGLYKHIFETLRIIDEISGVRAHLCMTTTREQIESGKVASAIELAKKYNATIGLLFPSPIGGWSKKHEVLIEDYHRDILDRLSSDPSVFLHGNLGKSNFRCPCGTTEIYITCYGDIIPCPFIQISFGNIKEEPFESIYTRMSKWSELNKKSPLCHDSEEHNFINRYTKPLHSFTHLPLPYNQHPNIEYKAD